MGWVNKFVKEDEQNIALHVGYGINYHIDSRWCLMPGVGLRLKGFGHDNENAGNCSSTYIDFPILVQYHFGGEKRQGIVLECGPVLSLPGPRREVSWGSGLVVAASLQWKAGVSEV